MEKKKAVVKADVKIYMLPLNFYLIRLSDISTLKNGKIKKKEVVKPEVKIYMLPLNFYMIGLSDISTLNI